MKVIKIVCTKKIFFQEKLFILGLKMANPHNFVEALRIFLKFCRMKGANRCMKVLIVIFREKKSFGQFDLFRQFVTV